MVGFGRLPRLLGTEKATGVRPDARRVRPRRPPRPAGVTDTSRCEPDETTHEIREQENSVKYELLGPLRVVSEEGTYESIGAQKIETLLAVLLIRSNQVVATERLTTEIWGERVPRSATAGIHVYISQLRKFLSRCGGSRGPIVTRPPGYALRSGADELDFRSFLRLVGRGRDHAREGRYDQASDCFENALDIWRGPVLGDLSKGPIVKGFVTWLTETRLECIEMLIDAQLKLGRHRELVGRLYSLTAEHPLRESFSRQLMLALYRSERQTDALEVYRSVRQTIHDELGLEPCRALQELQRGILAADYELEWAS
jgi:DNA-binding SARP family transcriptional activator